MTNTFCDFFGVRLNFNQLYFLRLAQGVYLIILDFRIYKR